MRKQSIIIGFTFIYILISTLPAAFAKPSPDLPDPLPSVTLKEGYPKMVNSYQEWRYIVHAGRSPALSHLVFEIEPYCDPPEAAFILELCGTTFTGGVIITIVDDPKTGVRGLKFDFQGNIPDNAEFEIWFTLNAAYPVGSGGDGSDGWGGIEVWFKSGTWIGNLMVEGPDSVQLCIPEVPYGTISIIVAFVLALVLVRGSKFNLIKIK